MSSDWHCASGQDYYSQNDSKYKGHSKKAKPEEEKYFYENGVKYKLVFDSEIRAWVKEVVSENKKEK